MNKRRTTTKKCKMEINKREKINFFYKRRFVKEKKTGSKEDGIRSFKRDLV
jgi:hypothetical protein